MSDNIWDRFNWPSSTSSTASAYREHNHHEEMVQAYEMKILKERMASPAKAEIDLRAYAKDFLHKFEDEVPQYMRSVMGDFEKQHEQKDVEEPQTVFHFDPKGIVNKWPEREI